MGEPAPVSSDIRPDASQAGPDSHLRWLVERLAGDELAPAAASALDEACTAARGPVATLHASLLRTPPLLDGAGGVTVGVAARDLERESRSLGLVGSTYLPGWRNLARRAPRALTAAVLLSLAETDRAVAGGSLLVTDAVCRTLERHDPALAARWMPQLTGAAEPPMTAAILLTEARSGADLGQIETTALPDGDGGWRLTGEKGLAANAGADLSLILARPQGAVGGTRGLALFAVPRRLEGGSPNAMRVESLRDSAALPGLPGLAIGRVRLAGARAWLVGRPGRGFRQAMDVVTATRILLGVVAAAIARQAAEGARTRARRPGEDRRVGAEPLYREELAGLVVDAVAATTGALVGADVLQQTDHGRLGNEGSLRLLAPLLKRSLSQLAADASMRAIRLAGGSVSALERGLLDDAIAIAAWEGSPNVLALEVVRAADQGHATALFTDLERRLSAAGLAAPLTARLLEDLARQRAELEELALLDEPVQQVQAAHLADRLAMLTLSSLLAEQGGAYAEETGSGRLLWIAGRFAARLAGAATVAAAARDARWLRHAAALLDDQGPVPLAVGRDAVRGGRGGGLALRGARGPSPFSRETGSMGGAIVPFSRETGV